MQKVTYSSGLTLVKVNHLKWGRRGREEAAWRKRPHPKCASLHPAPRGGGRTATKKLTSRPGKKHFLGQRNRKERVDGHVLGESAPKKRGIFHPNGPLFPNGKGRKEPCLRRGLSDSAEQKNAPPEKEETRRRSAQTRMFFQKRVKRRESL